MKTSTAFVVIDPPDSIGTGTSAINNRGDVVGSFFTGSNSFGFLYSSGAYTRIGSSNTFLRGLNDSDQAVGASSDVTHDAILFSDGNVSDIAPPGAVQSEGAGINERGEVTGEYDDPNGVRHGFIYKNGGFKQLDVPGSISTQPFAINDRGEIVGSFGHISASGTFISGFTYNHGNFFKLDVPGASFTLAEAVNNRGDIAGFYERPDEREKVFVYHRTGELTTLDLPQSTINQSIGINNRGEVVGSYHEGDADHGFLYDDGHIFRVDVTGAGGTYISAVNDKGMITGEYVKDGALHSFLAGPPQHSSTTDDGFMIGNVDAEISDIRFDLLPLSTGSSDCGHSWLSADTVLSPGCTNSAAPSDSNVKAELLAANNS